VRPRGAKPVRVGIVMLVVIAIAVFFGFTKRIPFTHGFRVQAVFQSAVNIKAHSPVRIAGVNVGQVTGVHRLANSNAAVVDIQLSHAALPLHKDATLKIRPRIFLEGNFFVDLRQGSPSAPTLSDGATIPITQTSDPVQLDQVLSALNSDTRGSLQDFLAGYGQSLTHVPTAAENATQDRTVRGLTGAQALNRATHLGAQALPDSAVVSQALGGQTQHDVSQLVSGLDRISIALDVRESDLQGLITNFDTTLGALASQSSNLRAAVNQLPGALVNADHALATLDAALPPARAFALELIPGVRELPATINAALPWISETRALIGAAELGGVARELSSATPSLGSTTPALTNLTSGIGQASSCLNHVLLPATNTKLQDGQFSSGVENYKEFFYSLVGLAGEGANFDGNGQYVHFLVDGGGSTLHTGPSKIVNSPKTGTPLIARSPLPLLGTRPAYPGVEPPYKPGVRCDTQALPDFNGPLSSGPADGSAGGG
jgi:virulence factor Mce-like protein